jgi:hypothetical protein
LSGKKFKGPEFVRKHILGKHADKLEEVAAEVTYFNNYLVDAHRPQPPAPDENALHRVSECAHARAYIMLSAASAVADDGWWHGRTGTGSRARL